jgi:threonine aldolase
MNSPKLKFQFASDNTAPISPEAWAAMDGANSGYAASYGDDVWTERAAQLFRDTFETDCDVFSVFNGTAANSLSLATLCRSYHSVICHESSHIETDECGAPEFFSNGTKILVTSGPEGKLNLREVEKVVTRRSDLHYPKPRVLSLSQPTELGSVYQPDEIREVCAMGRRYGLRAHMDGARFWNALAALDVAPRMMTWEAGVDVLCCGGTKNGIGFSEAVIFFNRKLGQEFDYRCKQAGQLASKMRYLAAPWVAALSNGTWKRHAQHANRAAKKLAEKLAQVSGVEVMYRVEANAVFVRMSEEFHAALHAADWRYYTFIGGGARFMCSWHTSDEDIDTLIRDLQLAAK